MKIKIAESCLYVTDLTRSRKFFSEVLGFSIKKEGVHDSGRHWIKYDLGIELLIMDGAQGSGRVEPIGSVVETMTCLEVDDYDAFRKRIEDPSLFEKDEPGYMVLRDPDGNRIEVYKWS